MEETKINVMIDKSKFIDEFVNKIIEEINNFGNKYHITGYEMIGALEIIKTEVLDSLEDEE